MPLRSRSRSVWRLFICRKILLSDRPRYDKLKPHRKFGTLSHITKAFYYTMFYVIQKNSYQWFLDKGLREVFRDTAAISDFAGNLELSFIDYSMDNPLVRPSPL